MRSAGGTNFGLALSVVVLTNSTIACLAAPSFHDGSGSVCAYAWFSTSKNKNPAPIILFIIVRSILLSHWRPCRPCVAMLIGWD